MIPDADKPEPVELQDRPLLPSSKSPPVRREASGVPLGLHGQEHGVHHEGLHHGPLPPYYMRDGIYRLFAAVLKELSVNNHDFVEGDEGGGQVQQPYKGQVCFLVPRHQFPEAVEP